MKILLILAVSIASIQAVSFSDLVLEQWETFKLTHRKHYENPSEDQYRMKLFMENARNISKHNQLYQKGQVSFELKLNQWADLSSDEYRRVVSCLKRNKDSRNHATTHIYPAHVKIPDEVDWRKEGAVTEVKNQGGCGACWAFSSTGTLEGQNFRKTGKLVSLSEQNLVDCVQGSGCDGGYTHAALQYVADNQGIDTEETYPYEQVDGQCRYDPNNSGATSRGYTNVPYGDENELKTAVATVGPISVAIDASNFPFKFYSGGVHYDPYCSSEYLDHAVLAVGYGTDENGQDYWLVKNSWGAGWGDQGYVKMARNRNNNCGIATDARFPLM